MHIDMKMKIVKALAKQTNTSRQLQTMPGVGPLTALAIEALAPNLSSFRDG
jgi:transposase